MKSRFVFYVAVCAIAITAVGAFAEARMAGTSTTVAAKSHQTQPLH